MKVLVDTPLWSLLFRRKVGTLGVEDQGRLEGLKALIRDNRAFMIGPVRQEILSGIRDATVFERLRDRLRGIEDEHLSTEDFEEAARASNACRSGGNAGSGTDFLLCAVATRLDAPIYTTDRDFALYAQHLSIRLHQFE